MPNAATVFPTENGLLINRQRIETRWVLLNDHGQNLKLTVHDGLAGGPPRQWEVRGDVILSLQGKYLLVVNHVNIEKYVAGVVSSEISPDWHEEVLKAQAVAARTYVLYKQLLNEQALYDVVASVQDQVYTGAKQVNGSVQQAVDDTRGQVLTYEQRPIFAAYSSTAAGPTEDAFNVWAKDLPYLKGVDCPFDEGSPRYQWETAIPFEVFEQSLRNEGLVVGAMATLAPYTFTRAGRVNEVRILHSKGELIVRGQDLRRILGYSKIRSTQFHIAGIGQEVVFTGKGAGHAVGLCQWGAKEMAELGYRYESILQYYYPGTDLLPYNRVDMSPMPSS
ncbi:SpoIID/LytB domain-containing protein [Candidatus Nitronereus thalassa]|uniref:SpoIID/LytB domain-containing protein n=1 Tax=Candidatus Nitronereus thalassa TaxID=3020898 RepID=A0ABU3K7R7_9BACT|nr:SpoIID/LytB domain-containing protein [Candidatus Nitronereus thalassa]MDT7042407.1 SpoIID/LytB domain-containing protein [Candidatus Nitronereus thalassa]